MTRDTPLRFGEVFGLFTLIELRGIVLCGAILTLRRMWTLATCT